MFRNRLTASIKNSIIILFSYDLFIVPGVLVLIKYTKQTFMMAFLTIDIFNNRSFTFG
jgi:hypothetical protein